MEAVAALDRALVELCQAHLEEFPAATPPKAPEAEPVDPRAIRRGLRAKATEGISIFNLGKRRAARRAADARLEDAVNEEEERRRDEQAEQQTRLDKLWADLRANDPETVLAVLEAAFEDNEAPAAAVNCAGDEIQVLVRWPPLDAVVGERKLATTPTGRPTHHKRSKTERNELYLEAMASNVLASAKEAFAIAPGINSIALLVIRGQDDPATGHTRLDVLFSGNVERDRLAQLYWAGINPAAVLEAIPGGELKMAGRTKEVQPLPVDQELGTPLGDVAEQLGWELELEAL